MTAGCSPDIGYPGISSACLRRGVSIEPLHSVSTQHPPTKPSTYGATALTRISGAASFDTDLVSPTTACLDAE